jgi:hypothetical protein
MNILISKLILLILGRKGICFYKKFFKFVCVNVWARWIFSVFLDQIWAPFLYKYFEKNCLFAIY